MFSRMLARRFPNLLLICLISAVLTACGGGGGGGSSPSSDDPTPPSSTPEPTPEPESEPEPEPGSDLEPEQELENAAPVANAGVDITVSRNQSVVLKDGGSDDADGEVVAYSWKQTAGLEVDLDGADTNSATFTAPTVDEETVLTFELTVTDDEGATGSADMSVTVMPPQYTLTSYGVTASDPSIITMGIGVRDRATGLPVLDLEITEESSDFDVREDGQQIKPREAFLDLEPLDNISTVLKTVLMLDVSRSLTDDDLLEVKEAAKNIVADLAENQQVAVYVFDDGIRSVSNFSRDSEQLNAAIDSIELGNPSTNLYGAVVEGFDLWSNSFQFNQITYGALILLTDGDDSASVYSLSDAIAAKGSREVFALAVGDADSDVLVQLALGTTLDEVTDGDREQAKRRVFSVNDYSEVDAALQVIAEEVQELTEGVYFLYYASPRRSGQHTVSASITNNSPCGTTPHCVDTIEASFDATGFESVTPELIVSNPAPNGTLEAGTEYPLSARVRWYNPPFTYDWSLDNLDGGMTLEVDPEEANKANLVVADNAMYSQGTVIVSEIGSSLSEELNFRAGLSLNLNNKPIDAGETVKLLPLSTYKTLKVTNYCPECIWTVEDPAVVELGSDVGHSAVLRRGEVSGTTTVTVVDPTTGKMAAHEVLSQHGFPATSTLTARNNTSCVADGHDVYCWGEETAGTAPELANPKQLALGSSHECALNDSDITCWTYGSYDDIHTQVPELQNPVQVAAGNHFTCALDDTGVQCWGYDWDGQSSPPEMDSPSSIAAGPRNACAIDGEQLRCWGVKYTDGGVEVDWPTSSGVKDVALGTYYGCAVIGGSVQCWGTYGSRRLSVPVLSNPTHVAVGELHACALHDGGVRCWGDDDYSPWVYYAEPRVPQPDASAFNNPVAISAGAHHTCAIDESGVQCWGYNEDGQTDVPN